MKTYLISIKGDKLFAVTFVYKGDKTVTEAAKSALTIISNAQLTDEPLRLVSIAELN